MVCRVKRLKQKCKYGGWRLEGKKVRKDTDLNVMDWVLRDRFSATPFFDTFSQQFVNTQILLHCVDDLHCPCRPHTHSLSDHPFTARCIEPGSYVLGKLSNPQKHAFFTLRLNPSFYNLLLRFTLSLDFVSLCRKP